MIYSAASTDSLHSCSYRAMEYYFQGVLCAEDHGSGVSELLSSNIQETRSHQICRAAQTISREHGIAKQDEPL